MDGPRFDRLAKTVASSVSRRSLLKALVGVGAAVVIDTAKIGDAAAATKRAPGDICRKGGDCASGLCSTRDSTGRQRCLCGSANDCGAGLRCADGLCVPLVPVGGACATTNDCQAELDCCNSVCTDLETDLTSCGACNSPCTGDQSCVSGSCTVECASGYKPCGNTCIPLASCCTAGGCNGSGCENGLCVCGDTTCGAGQVCNESGICSNGCFIVDAFNPNGKFWIRGEYNADGNKPCRICQPEENLNFWVNAPAGNPCANDCQYACDGAGACDTTKQAGPAIDDQYETCTVNCEMDSGALCCGNCWSTYGGTYVGGTGAGYCSSGSCVGPIGRFST